MLEFLPQYIKNSLSYVNASKIYELRLRAEKPITVNFFGRYTYLGEKGLTEIKEKALRASVTDIADCVYRAGQYSVYAVEEQIRRGFITAACGERIGLAGEYVYERGQPHTIRDLTSLCIRVPHEVVGCATEIYKNCMADKVRDILIASPPGFGKTTLLRDLSRLLSENKRANILICDERGEIGNGDVGDSSDVIRYADKSVAFESGIRALRPDIIVTDELSERDYGALEKARRAGVHIVASAHYVDFESLPSALKSVFDRFVFLDPLQIGKTAKIYGNEKDGGARVC